MNAEWLVLGLIIGILTPLAYRVVFSSEEHMGSPIHKVIAFSWKHEIVNGVIGGMLGIVVSYVFVARVRTDSPTGTWVVYTLLSFTGAVFCTVVGRIILRIWWLNKFDRRFTKVTHVELDNASSHTWEGLQKYIQHNYVSIAEYNKLKQQVETLLAERSAQAKEESMAELTGFPDKP